MDLQILVWPKSSFGFLGTLLGVNETQSCFQGAHHLWERKKRKQAGPGQRDRAINGVNSAWGAQSWRLRKLRGRGEAASK